MAYIDPKILTTFAEATENTSSKTWEQLAEAASLQFDRAADLSENFFGKSKPDAFIREFRANGTQYLKILPFVLIEEVEINDQIINTELYFVSHSYLVFDSEIQRNTVVSITAKWGFAEIPADVKQAVIEQALFLWRKKDLSFADLSGVASSVANAETSQTFQAVAKKYNELYAGVNFA